MQKQDSSFLLSVSVVLYDTDSVVLEKTLQHLVRAVDYLRARFDTGGFALYLLDNHPDSASISQLDQACFDSLGTGFDHLELLKPGENLGYGAGHNRCIERFDSHYHLILNPDVYLDEKALFEGVAYLEANPDVGLLAPHAVDEQQAPLFLCKRFPTILDFLLRGFAPAWIKARFASRLARYEMQDLYAGGMAVKDVPIISGCCMLARLPLLRSAGGFSPDYFLYFEDFDLSLRMAWLARVAYCPSMRIVHVGGHSAKKGWQHIRLFLRSAKTFFDTYGWRWF